MDRAVSTECFNGMDKQTLLGLKWAGIAFDRNEDWNKKGREQLC